MNKFLYLLLALICLTCKKKDNSGQNTGTINQPAVSVFTQHNNNSRAGLNNRETVLTSANVNAAHFGKLFSMPVDDQVYAQPLVAADLIINGGLHNVVYIATVNNSVYAYDADNGTLYWKKNFSAQGMRAPRNTDMTGACGGGYQDFSGNIGIVGTPVIDTISKTIYFVARSTDGSNYAQHLHAIDLISGNEKAGSPVKITAQYAGTGDGNIGNIISFDSQRQNQRPALTLLNGIVFIAFSSHCDWGPYHGWVLGYNASTLTQQVVYNDTPDGYNGGIWESGTGAAADDAGNLYMVTGNGSVGISGNPGNPRNRGESALKLSVNGSTLIANSFFTPYNYVYLENNDLDYGAVGSFLIPNSNFFFTGCKDGNLYILNKDNMGGYNTSTNQIQQTIFLNSNANEHCQPAYFKGAANEYVYIWSENDPLRALPFNRAINLFDMAHQLTVNTGGPTGQNGAMLSVSSNGTTAGSGILWAVYAKSCDAEHNVCPGILRAFNAEDITHEIWNSDLSAADAVGNYAKFCSPTIANGHVYLATFSNSVIVYGLK